MVRHATIGDVRPQIRVYSDCYRVSLPPGPLISMEHAIPACPFTGSVELGVSRLAELGRFVAACLI